MTELPRYWRKIDEPEAGVYELLTLAGWDQDGDPKNCHVLYVVKSLEGFLTEAFKWDEVGKVWRYLTESDPRPKRPKKRT